MTHKEAIRDLNAIKDYFEQEGGAYPVSLEYAIKVLKNELSADMPQKVIAQVAFDEEKLREIVKEAVERFKEEYEIVDRPQGEWIEQEDCWQCSECGDEYVLEVGVKPIDARMHYCPNCGAHMKGADDE